MFGMRCAYFRATSVNYDTQTLKTLAPNAISLNKELIFIEV